MPKMVSLKWSQVNAWRLARQHLSDRLERRRFLQAVESCGGIQAQVMSAAEMALWTRTNGLSPEVIHSALWQDRTLVKTWAMRATLHLLVSADLPLYVAARNAHETRNWEKYFTFFGMTTAQMQAVIEAVPQVLGSEPMTRQQLARAVAKELHTPELGQHLLASSWGSLWKPSAWRGDLCFGPSQGQNVTFINPRRWLSDWASPEPYPALQEIARRYLHAYGPATPNEFRLWWGLGLTHSRKLFRSIEKEWEPVEVEGWQAMALKQDIPFIKASRSIDVVNLLPSFDAYLMGIGRGGDIEPLLPMPFQKKVFRPQGWISAVVLVDGRIQGIWQYGNRRPETTIIIKMFSPLTKRVRQRIEIEAGRLSTFLDAPIKVSFQPYDASAELG